MTPRKAVDRVGDNRETTWAGTSLSFVLERVKSVKQRIWDIKTSVRAWIRDICDRSTNTFILKEMLQDVYTQDFGDFMKNKLTLENKSVKEIVTDQIDTLPIEAGNRSTLKEMISTNVWSQKEWIMISCFFFFLQQYDRQSQQTLCQYFIQNKTIDLDTLFYGLHTKPKIMFDRQEKYRTAVLRHLLQNMSEYKHNRRYYLRFFENKKVMVNGEMTLKWSKVINDLDILMQRKTSQPFNGDVCLRRYNEQEGGDYDIYFFWGMVNTMRFLSKEEPDLMLWSQTELMHRLLDIYQKKLNMVWETWDTSEVWKEWSEWVKWERASVFETTKQVYLTMLKKTRQWNENDMIIDGVCDMCFPGWLTTYNETGNQIIAWRQDRSPEDICRLIIQKHKNYDMMDERHLHKSIFWLDILYQKRVSIADLASRSDVEQKLMDILQKDYETSQSSSIWDTWQSTAASQHVLSDETRKECVSALHDKTHKIFANASKKWVIPLTNEEKTSLMSHEKKERMPRQTYYPNCFRVSMMLTLLPSKYMEDFLLAHIGRQKWQEILSSSDVTYKVYVGGKWISVSWWEREKRSGVDAPEYIKIWEIAFEKKYGLTGVVEGGEYAMQPGKVLKPSVWREYVNDIDFWKTTNAITRQGWWWSHDAFTEMFDHIPGAQSNILSTRDADDIWQIYNKLQDMQRWWYVGMTIHDIRQTSLAPQWINDHAYAVMGIDNETREVILVNPHYPDKEIRCGFLDCLYDFVDVSSFQLPFRGLIETV